MRRCLMAAGFTLLAACSEKPAVSDTFFMNNKGAVLIGAMGAGMRGEFEAALSCDPTGVSGWPPLRFDFYLPEAGQTIDSDKRFAIVDGRKVPLRLTLKIDGRAFKVSDYWVQQHKGLKLAFIAGRVENGEALAKALEKAKSIEFAGDGRRYRIDVRAADNLKAYADICRAAAAMDVRPAAQGESAAKLATRLSNDEIEAAIVGRWRNGNAEFEDDGLRYRITAGVETPESEIADAQARGIRAFPGVGFETEDAPFQSVYAAYAVFDDPAAADAYFSDADYNLGEQEVAEIMSFRIERPGYPVVTMNCVFVPDADNSVNCHYKTPDRRIVAVLLFAVGPALDFSGDERAVDLVFANEAAADRTSLVASASWAYLYDAVYR